jgi:hypothetical protein
MDISAVKIAAKASDDKVNFSICINSPSGLMGAKVIARVATERFGNEAECVLLH